MKKKEGDSPYNQNAEGDLKERRVLYETKQMNEENEKNEEKGRKLTLQPKCRRAGT